MDTANSNKTEQDKDNNKSDKDNNKSDKDNKKVSNWKGFGLSLIGNLVMTILFGIIGSNFIFFTTLDNLELFFPTEPEYYFGGKVPRNPSVMEMRGGKYTCPQRRKMSFKGINKDFLKSFNIGNVSGFPYSLKVNEDDGISFDSFKNWFATTIADTYMFNRKLLQEMYKKFAPVEGDGYNILSSQTLQMILAPFILLITNIVVPILSLGTTLYNSFSNTYSGLIWSVVGIFFGYIWLMTSGVSIAQTIQNLLTSLFLPLIIDPQTVLKILDCNKKFLSMLFGVLAVVSGIMYLDNTISTVMIITYLLLLGKYLFF